ncbi:MAG TPA: hypothetical protein DF296_10070 [Candidatus Margulisbacteria bacterium]|nr:MAG: hypothetical protein A2X43_11060 [Candidatus Margulisbacteria bacterium GWD2_39_127]OGI02768.1 MAG: hypothetical protein A2X42_01885 [Candidatus Margulisbacteria bacterium GWF2_38_17]OGI09345.1 MAG: hypothetical protein A2X41_09490 [Candidatus Margulisbacteria bacterium GWE2_39_32]HAR63996.1 hypothetical protein [Candidatus Margulisiibacteriota bacterium]HCT85532.1 hypothetical protein [Candidatus Margulisiibacteriota bacterium]
MNFNCEIIYRLWYFIIVVLISLFIGTTAFSESNITANSVVNGAIRLEWQPLISVGDIFSPVTNSYVIYDIYRSTNNVEGKDIAWLSQNLQPITLNCSVSQNGAVASFVDAQGLVNSQKYYYFLVADDTYPTSFGTVLYSVTAACSDNTGPTIVSLYYTTPSNNSFIQTKDFTVSLNINDNVGITINNLVLCYKFSNSLNPVDAGITGNVSLTIVGEAPSFSAFATIPASTATQNYLYYWISGTDAAGNPVSNSLISPNAISSSIQVYFDNVQPAIISINLINDKAYDVQTLAITASVTEIANDYVNSSGLQDGFVILAYRLNGFLSRLPMQVVGSIIQGSVPGLSDGDDLSFWFEGSDMAGNEITSNIMPFSISETTAMKVKIDTLAPHCSTINILTINNNSVVKNRDTFLITANIVDSSLITANIFLDLTPVNGKSQVTPDSYINGVATWELIASTNLDGNYFITLNATDEVGKSLGGVITASVIVDTDQPQIAYISSYEGTNTIVIKFTEPVIVTADLTSASGAFINGIPIPFSIPRNSIFSDSVTGTIGIVLSSNDILGISIMDRNAFLDRAGNVLTGNISWSDKLTGYSLFAFRDEFLTQIFPTNNSGNTIINGDNIYLKIIANENISENTLALNVGQSINESIAYHLVSTPNNSMTAFYTSFNMIASNNSTISFFLTGRDIAGNDFNVLSPANCPFMVFDTQGPSIITHNIPQRLRFDRVRNFDIVATMNENSLVSINAFVLNWKLYDSSNQPKSVTLSCLLHSDLSQGDIPVTLNNFDFSNGGIYSLNDCDYAKVWFSGSDVVGNALNTDRNSPFYPAAIIVFDSGIPSLTVLCSPSDAIKTGTTVTMTFTSNDLLETTLLPTINLFYTYDSSSQNIIQGIFLNSTTYIATFNAPSKPGTVNISAYGFEEIMGYEMTESTGTNISRLSIDNTSPYLITASCSVPFGEYIKKEDFNLYFLVYEAMRIVTGDVFVNMAYANQIDVITMNISYVNNNYYLASATLPVASIGNSVTLSYWFSGHDSAGNRLETQGLPLAVTLSEGVQVGVDGVAPSITIQTPTRSTTLLSSVRISGIVSDNIASIANVIVDQYWQNGNTYFFVTENAVPVTINFYDVTMNLMEGNNLFVVKAQDVAGNESSENAVLSYSAAEGTNASNGLSAKIIIPLGAYEKDVNLDVHVLSSLNSAAMGITNNTYLGGVDVKISGIENPIFALPVKISIDLPSGTTTSQLLVLWWNPSTASWNASGITSVNVIAQKVTFYTNHFTTFGIFSTADLIAPDLSGVYIDGELISTNDYVSSRPELKLLLRDNSAGIGLTMSTVELYRVIGVVDTLISMSTTNYQITTEQVTVIYRPYENLFPGSYFYKVTAKDANNNILERTSPVFRIKSLFFDFSAIHGPNPFSPDYDGINDILKITYQMSENAEINIRIFDITGKMLQSWHFLAGNPDGGNPGYNEVLWDGRNRYGEIVANGVYFAVVTAENINSVKKKAILKIAVLK